MSSRRKSKPARRVDSICSKLTEEYGTKVGVTQDESQQNVSPDSSQPNGTQSIPTQNNKDGIEGVYVIEPQSVSDCEGPHEKTERCNATGSDSKSQDMKKSFPKTASTSRSSQPSTGLDLSVKRPRYDNDYANGNTSRNSTPPIQPSHAAEHLMGINEEQLKKFDKLPSLINSGKNITEALEEIGLNPQQFFALHWLNQFNYPNLKKEPVPDDYQVPDTTLRLSREDFIQQQKQMAEARSCTRPQTSTATSNMNDSHDAASLYNEQDMPAGDGGDQFQNYLMQAYAFMSPNAPTSSMPRSFDRMNLSQNDGIGVGPVSSGSGSIKEGTLDPATFDQEVFDKYITKFTSTKRCVAINCQYYTRDHYHCMVDDCHYQRFTNKADVIRHYNMHKKRDNSLAHGFLRYSPSDDCSQKYPNCPHRGKSTHYHCMQPDCNKVYTSTSDVMTHENFHKKYMQFVCSGFKRFRATELCDLQPCVFRFQKTTHFHCTRPDCNFTFKNKCDIEKHKTYHQRDDHFIQRGFKKYYKNESCGVPSCVWNMTSNHLHCLRAGCTFSFTSSSQMESHIRKHDRNDFSSESQENSPDVANTSIDPSLFNPIDSHDTRSLLTNIQQSVARNSILSTSNASDYLMDSSQSKPVSTTTPSTSSAYIASMQTEDTPTSSSPGIPTPVSEPSSKRMSPSSVDNNSDAGGRSLDRSLTVRNIKQERDDLSSIAARLLDYNKSMDFGTVTKFFIRFSALKCPFTACEFLTKDHFHCMVDGCGAIFTSNVSTLSHGRFHLNLEFMGVLQPLQLSSATQIAASVNPPTPDSILKSVAGVPDSIRVSLPSTTTDSQNPFVRLNYHTDGDDTSRMVETDVKPVTSALTMPTHAQSPISMIPSNILTAMFQTPSSSQAMLSGHSLRNFDFLTSAASMTSTPVTSTSLRNAVMEPSVNSPQSSGRGYMHFAAEMSCTGPDCKYAGQNHWHCTNVKCRYVCKSQAKAESHYETHENMEVYSRKAKESFKSYSLKKPCPYPNCEFKLRGHYHCLQPGCSFVTIGTSKLPWHMKKHVKIATREASGFKYYTKKERCRYPDCKYSSKDSHYHCIRHNCTFAFQYKHQMQTHVRKHIRKMQGKNRARRMEKDQAEQSNIESGDDSLSLVIDEMDGETGEAGSIGVEVGSNISNEQDAIETEGLQEGDAPEQMEHTPNQSPERMVANEYEKPLDFSSVASRSNGPTQIREEESSDDVAMDQSPEPPVVANLSFFQQDNNESSGAEASPNVKSNLSVGQFSRFRVDDTMLAGFQRYEANEDCGSQIYCPYKIKNAAHYHCTRDGCTYSFAGRSHMYKHAQHHERVAGLVRNDFKRYKGSTPCDNERCSFRGKNTHFHCLRCNFICTDSAKVGTHRRQHMKSDTLQKSGFKRVGGKEDCRVVTCKYRFRNMSHFHCMQPGCNYAIVGLAGIEMHADKHKKGSVAMRQSRSNSIAPRNLLSLQSLTQLGLGLNNMTNPASMVPPISADFVQNSSMTDAPSSSNDGSDNGHSNRSSPSLPPPQDERNQILPQFAVLGSASSPVSANPLNRVTEGVGS